MKDESLPFKLKLLYNISLSKIQSIDKNNIVKELPFEYEDIKSIQKCNNPYFFKFLYINKDKVHDKLYDKDILLNTDFESKDEKIISPYIFLCFTVEESKTNDYQYSFDLIKRLNEIQINEKENALKKIIISKMILLLIYNYNQIIDNEDNKDNKHKKELDDIFNFNKEIFEDNENRIKLNPYKLKLDYKLEEIYLIIIKYLIENSKLEDSDFTENIINQIELESIILTKFMLSELITILTKEKEYIKNYKIGNFDDIFNEKIINFYYNLIKYIIKQNLYIYQIPFLFETKKSILNLIKDRLKDLSPKIEKNENKDKIKYILQQFFGDNLYNLLIKKSQSNDDISDSLSTGPSSIKSLLSKNTSSLKSFGYYFEEENNENELEYKILNNSKFTLHTNKKGEKPFIIYDEIKIIINEKESENKTIEEIRNTTTKYERLSNNYNKFLSFLNEFEIGLSNKFNNNYKLKVTLNFETKKIDKNNNFIITCLYEVAIPEQEIRFFKDNNILIDGLDEGFDYLLNEINESYYFNIEYS